MSLKCVIMMKTQIRKYNSVRRMNVRIRDNIILWGNFYAIIIMGMITLFVGSNMPNIRAFYQLTYEQGGLILSLFAAGGLVFSFLSGVVGDFIGMKRMLFITHTLFVIGLVMIYLSQSTIILYIGVFLIGGGAGAFTTIANIIVNDFTHGDGKVMSLLHMCFGIGAFIIPMLSAALIQVGFHWKGVLLLLLVLEVVSIFLTVKMKIQTHISHTGDHKLKTRDILKSKRLYVFMAILFFYVGAENALNGWMVTYLIRGLSLSDVFAQQMLSLFWIVMMLGRYLNSIISQKMFKENIIIISSFGAAIMVILFIKASSPITITVITALMALMFSGMYPITFANANSVVKGSGAAGAILTSGGSTGSMLIPYISGIAAEKGNITGILYTVLIALMAMSLFAYINKKMQTEFTLTPNPEVII